MHVQTGELAFDVGESLGAHGGKLGGDDYIRTLTWQPKAVGNVPQAPVVEDSAGQQ